MKKLVWTEECSVGIAVLDNQHKKIISLINKLIEQPDLTVYSEAISDIISELTQYASDHFHYEEELLAKYNYPDLEHQKKEHRDFRFKVVQFCSAATEHVNEVPEILLNYLSDWWCTHIHDEDMLYREFLNSKGIF